MEINKVNTTESQRIAVWKHLQVADITPLEALTLYGCFRLGARIFELRKEGKKIKTEMIDINGKRVARYSIIKN